MSIEMTRKALLWCAVINYGILLVWFLFFMLAHDRMYLFHSRWFHISVGGVAGGVVQGVVSDT